MPSVITTVKVQPMSPDQLIFLVTHHRTIVVATQLALDERQDEQLGLRARIRFAVGKGVELSAATPTARRRT